MQQGSPKVLLFLLKNISHPNISFLPGIQRHNSHTMLYKFKVLTAEYFMLSTVQHKYLTYIHHKMIIISLVKIHHLLYLPNKNIP